MQDSSRGTSCCAQGASCIIGAEGESPHGSIAYAESEDALWDSALKCKKGVSAKPSVKQFCNHIATEVCRMHRQLADGTWEDGDAHPVTILYPKKREGLAIRFRDRVYQRSLNDNIIYPAMTKSFIRSNCACQHGRGPDYARKLVKKSLHRIFIRYGYDFYVLQIDVKGYYPHMRHDKIAELFREKLDGEVADRVERILAKQGNTGEGVGYHPGSQLVQIAGISLLDRIDHSIKERLGCHDYIRVMDDMLLLHPAREYLEVCLEEIVGWLADIGLETNVKKTHITPISDGFTFLGFRYAPGQHREFYMSPKGQCVKHEKKKLYRLRKKGDRAKADECLQSFVAHLKHGNTQRLQQRLWRWQDDLWRQK